MELNLQNSNATVNKSYFYKTLEFTIIGKSNLDGMHFGGRLMYQSSVSTVHRGQTEEIFKIVENNRRLSTVPI